MLNINKKTAINVLISLAVIITGSIPSFATSYYVCDSVAVCGAGWSTGADSNAGTSKGSPKKTIRAGVAALSSGDTLIIGDGTYTGSSNIIGDYASPQTYIPSGTAGNFTTVKAEHVGQAIMDGQYSVIPFAMFNRPTYRDYTHIDGIHFRRGKGEVFSIAGNHNWVSNCGFEDGMPYASDTESPIAEIGGDSTYNLIEDCWIWGKGRYGFYTSNSHSSGSHNNVLRRLVVRLDAVPAGWMSANLRFYSAHDGAMQNCIAIDSLVASNSAANGTCAECWMFAQGGGSSEGEWGHIFNGNIALNSPNRYGFSNEIGILDNSKSNVWSNSVIWGLAGAIVPYNLSLSDSALNISGNKNIWTVTNMLIGNSVNGIELSANRTNETYNISNTIFTGNSTSAFGGAGQTLTRTMSNIIAYNNGSNVCSSGNGCTATNLNTSTNPLTNIVKYLPRVESGTIGPTITYQIGGTGTFYGDSGWNTTSSTPLWPFPNEQLWSAKMKAYSVNAVSGNRGFAALNSPTPLTDYIWGYLGNIVPPFNLTTTSTSSSSVKLSWAPNTANANIAGYKVYVGTLPGTYNLAGYVGGKNVGLVTTEPISGLTQDTIYYAAVTAVASNNVASGYSYELSFKTGPKPPAGLKIVSSN